MFCTRRPRLALISWLIPATYTALSSRASMVHARTLVARDSVNVTVVCQSDSSWMSNGKDQSPCVVAAWVQAACSNTGSWSVAPLASGKFYDPPSSADDTVNACACSWATYNLLSACTDCQGSVEIETWGAWQMNCAQLISGTTYFPSDKGFTLSTETAIPYWAGQNPATWTSAQFDASQAQSIAQQGHPDLTGATSTASSSPSSTAAPTKSSSNIGPIVGGVIGGLAVVLLALVYIACRVVRKRRRQGAQQQVSQRKPPPPSMSVSQQSYPGSPSPRPDLEHARSMSDSSMAHLDPARYADITPFSMPVMPPPTAPMSVVPISPQMQLVTASGGVRNYPANMAQTPGPGPSSFSHPYPSSYPTFSALSPTSPTAQTAHSSQTNLPPSASASASQIGFGSLVGGGSNERRSSHPANDPSNGSASVVRGNVGHLGSVPSQRGRLNPPMYTTNPGSGEVQTMAPTAPDDTKMKQVYQPVGMTVQSDKKEDVAMQPEVVDRPAVVPADEHDQEAEEPEI